MAIIATATLIYDTLRDILDDGTATHLSWPRRAIITKCTSAPSSPQSTQT